MNAMQKMAEQENIAVRRSWSGGELHKEVKSEITLALRDVDFRNADTLHEIIEIVSEESGVPKGDLLGNSRTKFIARARQYAMWKCRDQGYSLQQIGHVFKRDHTTVIHGVRRIEEILNASVPFSHSQPEKIAAE